TQHNDHMGLFCLQFRSEPPRFTSDILANKLACPACIGVRQNICPATHHNLAKWTVAGLRLTFFNGNTESCTSITSQVLHVTALWPAGQIKAPIFPKEPDRENARESSRVKRRQMRGNRKSS